MNILVIYHANCVDGWVAALQAYKYYRDVAIDFVPAQYGGPIEVDYEAYNLIYVLDFSVYPVPKNMIVLDHHKSAFEKFDSGVEVDGLVVMDMNKSGARLAQEHFGFGEDWLVDYAEDRDLWRFVLPFSKEISAGLALEPMDSMDRWLELDRFAVMERGKVVLEYQEKVINGLVRKDNLTKLMLPVDGSSLIGAGLNTGFCVSEVGHKILETCLGLDFAFCFFMTGDGWVFSVRGPSARLVAEKFGGGGHDCAAGFKIGAGEIDQFLSKWQYSPD